jgi:hypothetical protein
MLVGSILVTGLVAVLVLHMFAAQYAFRATALQAHLNGLTNQVQAEQLAVESDSSPTALRNRAAGFGMLPATVSNVHLKSNGRAVETLTAQAPPVVVAPVTTTPTASPKATKSTKTGTTAKAGTTAKSGTAGKTGTATRTGTTTTSGTSGKHHHSHGTQAPQQ